MNTKTDKTTDKIFMKTALELAEKGRGMVNPNPMVGAVIVKGGKIIGRGFHERYGESHAERNAIDNCTISPENATMYVTLEPCCHTGKTPPCTDLIIKSKIARVVVGTRDSNPKVSGHGVKLLRTNGIKVDVGILEKECLQINKIFFHYIKTGRPYVTMKYAMTMDGKIAAASGASRWVTDHHAREHVHIQRSYNKAIMTGRGTIQKDDPVLSSRTDKGADRNPIRIICDTDLKVSSASKVINTADEIPTIIATCCIDRDKQRAYSDAGCRIIIVSRKENRVDLVELMTELGKSGIDSILLEGGSTLNWEMLRNGLVDYIQAYVAPKLFGGNMSKTPVGGSGINLPDDCCMLGKPKIEMIGNDLLIESEVIRCLQE